MRQSIRHQLFIAAVAAAVMFTSLGATRLWDQDEAFFARTAVEMHQRNEWVGPYFNGELFAHKPPLMFWMMRVAFGLFGVNEFAARFWSAVFGVAASLLVYRMGRRMFSAQVGLWAGLSMATAIMFDVVARAATPDSFLVFFCTLALYVFVRSENWNEKDAATPEEAGFTPLPWRTCALMYAAMGLAVLVKGPIGVLLPGSTIGLFLLIRNSPGESTTKPATWSDKILQFLLRFAPTRIVRAMWNMRPLTAIGAVLLVAGPWFALVGWRTGGTFLREFFGVHNYGRFVGAMDNHGGGIWYYLPLILAGFFPWSIFGVPTIVDLTRRSCGRDAWQNGSKFLASWIIVFVGFFSIAATKLPNYVLPAYPALALATGCFIDRWLSRPASVSHWWPRLSFGSLLLIGIATAIAAPILAKGTSHGVPILERLGISANLAGDIMLLAWLGAFLAIGGAICLGLGELGRRRLALGNLSLVAVTFCVALFAVLAVRVDRHQPSPLVAAAIQEHSTGVPQIAQFAYFQPSLVYYNDTRIEPCKTPQLVVDFLKQSSDSFVVTTDGEYAKLSPILPADIVVVDREPAFPRSGTLLVLGRKTTVAQRTYSRTE